MDVRAFEEQAAAIERQRRQDYWISIVICSAVLAGFIYVTLGIESHLAQNERLLAEAMAAQDAGTAMTVIRNTSMWMIFKFGAPLLMFIVPFLFDRYRWRQNKALIELLRAQSRIQASRP